MDTIHAYWQIVIATAAYRTITHRSAAGESMVQEYGLLAAASGAQGGEMIQKR
jgi:hypothetical protein